MLLYNNHYFQDTCIKETSCIDFLQYCDKSEHIVYGTCTYHLWFWAAIAFLGVFVASLFCCLIYWKLKK